jgi:phosphoribosyl-AMP cyclohydrolase
MMTRKEQIQLKVNKEVAILRIMDIVKSHITDQCKSLGYDNEDSIAKYLVSGNDFYTECKALSIWIGKVWTKLISIRADLESDSITEPTHDELIKMLPVY